MNSRIKNQLIITVAGLGMLLSTLDTGIINVALLFYNTNFNQPLVLRLLVWLATRLV